MADLLRESVRDRREPLHLDRGVVHRPSGRPSVVHRSPSRRRTIRPRDPHTPGVILLRRLVPAAALRPARRPAARLRSRPGRGRRARLPGTGRLAAGRRAGGRPRLRPRRTTSTGRVTAASTWPPGPGDAGAGGGGRHRAPSPARWPGAGWSASTTERSGPRTSRSRPQVPVGQRVAVGQTIGRVAAGGHCAGRCLHWGLRQRRDLSRPAAAARPAASGPLRLLAADQRAVASERARERAEAAAAAAAWLADRRRPTARSGRRAVTASSTRCRERSPRRSACGSIRCCGAGSCTTAPTSAPAAARRSGPRTPGR